MRILIRKSADGWQVRFGFGNPWKMPAGEWLPSSGPADTSAAVSSMLVLQFPGANVFTLMPIGEDLD